MNKKALFIFLLMMFALSSALFAGGFALSGIGSKAIGLGGAFRGMADDPSSMYWNPAGLASMDQSSITVAGAMITPTMDFTSTGTLVPGFGLPGFQLNKKITAEKKNWMFPNLFAIHANQNPLKYGIGVYVPYGLGATWDAFSLPTAMMYNDTLRTLKWASGFPKNEMESSIGVVDIHPTIAYQVSDKVAVGAGVSVNYGMITIAKLIPDTNASYYAPTTMYLKGTGWGVGGNVGVMWKPNPILSIGFAGKLPSSVQISGDAKIRTWLNNVVVYQTMHALDPVHYPHFSDQIPGAVVGDTTDAKATMNLPGDVGLGLSLKANDRWTINGDFAYTWWTVLSEVKIKMEPAAEIHTATGTVVINERALETKWMDTYRFSLGTQYQFNPVAVRLGFWYDLSPIPNKSLSPTWPDISQKLSGNVGFGFKFGKFGLDLNGEYISFKERTIKTQAADNMMGTYNTSLVAGNFGLTYHF